VVARDAGLYAMEQALHRRGFARVAGADEAGRGACAGPLVAAAAILAPGRRGEIPGLNDSKLLTPAAREKVYALVVKRALAWSVVVVPPGDIDSLGLHVCNVTAMRRALAGLSVPPDYVLTDGFRVDGLGVPGLAVWKGDQVAACVAAASVVAKVTRDRIMRELHTDWPQYGFAEHKGYSTPEHAAAMNAHGVTPHHRTSYANVAAVLAGEDANVAAVLAGEDANVAGVLARGAAGVAGLDGAADADILADRDPGVGDEDANVAAGLDAGPGGSSVGVSPGVVHGVASDGDGAWPAPMGENGEGMQSSAQGARVIARGSAGFGVR
jgi:ribonuclease HII